MDKNGSDNNVANSPAVTAAVSDMTREAVCFYSHNVGVTFKDNNSVAQNPVIVDALAKLSPEDITREDGQTTFPVDTHGLAHFMHLVYCHTGDGMKLRVELDGIFPFDAPDEHGVTQRFNAQLMSLSEVAE